MKQFILMVILSLDLNVIAQHTENKNIKSKIVEFFDAFHKQDTTALNAMVTDKVILQSISTNKEGKTILKEYGFSKFLIAIGRILKGQNFEEKLFGFNIQLDGNMAYAWIPYEFWYQDKFSNCGVNSFQLIKTAAESKISYLVDTRRQYDCRDNTKLQWRTSKSFLLLGSLGWD